MISQHPPAPFRHLPEARRQTIRREMESMVSGTRTRRPHRAAIIGGVSAFALLGTGAAAGAMALLHEPVTNKSYARCYTADAIGSGINFQGATVSQPASAAGPGQVSSAIDICAALWRQGIIGPHGRAPGSLGSTASHRVPKLVVCRMPDGTAAVFPGTAQTCARLGLPMAKG
jgi:hypothetical protein